MIFLFLISCVHSFIKQVFIRCSLHIKYCFKIAIVYYYYFTINSKIVFDKVINKTKIPAVLEFTVWQGNRQGQEWASLRSLCKAWKDVREQASWIYGGKSVSRREVTAKALG